MDEDRAILIELLQVDDKLRRIMLGISEDFCAKEGDDMIRNYWDRLVAEVSVVDAELGVKPVDFVRDEFSWDETLEMRSNQDRVWGNKSEIAYFGRDLGLNLGPLLFFALEDGGGVPGEILQLADGRIAVATRDPGGRGDLEIGLV